jgi:hypothetical protein
MFLYKTHDKIRFYSHEKRIKLSLQAEVSNTARSRFHRQDLCSRHFLHCRARKLKLGVFPG